MKNCDHFTKLFSDYLDDDLDEPAKHSLLTHLKDCPACETKLNELKDIKRSLATLPRVKTSASFDMLLHARLRQEMRQKRGWSFPFFEVNWRVPAFAAAAICFLFLGAFIHHMSTLQFQYSRNSNMIAIKNALDGELHHIDPGYMVFVDFDSVNNSYKIINYADLDNADSMQDFKKTTDDITVKNNLPDLKSAPQNQTVIVQPQKQNSRPRVKQAHFVF